MPSALASRPLTDVTHVVRVVGDDEDREVGQRQRDGGEDHGVLGDLDRVDGGQQDGDREQRGDQDQQVEPARARAATRTCPTASRSTARRSSRPTGRSRTRRRTSRRRSRAARTRCRSCRARRATGSPTWPSVLTSMPRGSSTRAAQAMIDEGEQAAEREAEEHVRPLRRRGPCGPLLLDPAGGEEEHLVRRHRRPEQGDRVVPVGREALARSGTVGCVGVLQQLPPVRAELPDRDGEDDQRQARQPEDVLHRRRTSPATGPARRRTPRTGRCSR